MKKLNPKDFQVELVRDLGMVGTVRKAIFLCPVCKVERTANTTDVRRGKSLKHSKCAMTKHGGRYTRLYKTWNSMLYRCKAKTAHNFSHYGGRGIVVCKAWEDFEVFREWANANGYAENLSIDRIDNDGNYEPSNCRWATANTQSRNQRRIKEGNKTGYRGVSIARSKFLASIRVGGSPIRLGVYDTAIAAAKVYDNFVIANKLEHTINKV